MGSANTTTYSFEDVTGAIAHPGLGAYTFDGKGVGEITIEMDADMSAHDRASDGSIMVSKLLGEPGRITLSVQQTSAIHKWLLAAYQYLKLADTSQWAQMAATVRNVVDGSTHILTGMSFMKVPPKSYQATGQRISWVIMCADIQSVPA